MKTSYRILMGIAAFMLIGDVFGHIEPSHIEVKLDSLEKVNAAYHKQDTVKLNLLNQLTFSYKNVYPNKGIETGEQAIVLAQKLNRPLRLAEAYHNLSLIHLTKSELVQAGELNEKALAINLSLNNKYGIAENIYYKGSILIRLGDYGRALEFYKENLIFFEETKNDEGIALAYRGIGDAHHSLANYHEALEFFQKALEISNKLSHKAGIAQNFYEIGHIYWHLSDYSKALEFIHKALRIHEELEDTMGIILDIGQLSGNYGSLADINRTLEYGHQVLDICVKFGEDNNMVADALRNMGNIYSSVSDYHKALEYYQKSMDISQKLGDTNDAATTMGDMGKAFTNLSEHQKALEYLQKSLRIKEQLGIKQDIANALRNMGNIYEHLFDFPNALECHQKSLGIAEQIGNKHYEALQHISLGHLYYNYSDLKNAYTHYQRSLNISEPLGIKSVITTSLIHTAKVYLDVSASGLQELGVSSDDRFTLTLKCLNKALRIAKEIGAVDQERDAWQNLCDAYERQKDFPKAYEAYKNYIILRDSIQGEETKRQFTRKEIQYEFDKKESELKLQQQLTDEQLQRQQLLHKRQRWIYLSAVLAFLGIAGLLAMRLRYARKKQQLLEQQKEMEFREAERLKELDRLKTMLYTNITHEFRTPLTVISGVTSELKNNPDTFDSGLETIQRNSVRLLNLVNQMLDLSKLQTGMLSARFINGDIVQYTGYVVQSFQSLAASRKITLHFLPEMTAFPMDYDAEKIMQILSNLISNAIKFTPAGGNVYLHLATVQSNHAEHLQIKVQDTGIGISQEHLPHIFDRFYQVEQTYRADKGTGIGLALTKEFIHFLGGTINVQSKPGKGSVFVATLPVTQEAADEAIEYLPESVHDVVVSFAPAHNGETMVQGNGVDFKEIPRLLIIEDTLDVISYLKMCLANDYRITEAHDGGEGVEIAIDTIPDIVITDVMMPVKDGYEVCKTLKEDERTSHIPIIMLTARADTHSKLAGLETGADAYLYKPFEKEELQIRLRKLLELRATLQKRYTNGKFVENAGDRNMEKEDHFISTLKEIVHAHLDDEDFGIVQLCKAMHLSRSQLHNKIKALTGRSTALFVRLIRLQKAKELLKDPEMHVSEVAYATGFKDPAYFTRCFVEDFGMNPSEFRNALTGNR